MAIRNVKITGPDGKPTDGFEVSVSESSERLSEYTLEDGTIIRGKVVVTGAVRIDGQYDPEGNPLYMIKSTPVFSVVQVQENLRRKVQ